MLKNVKLPSLAMVVFGGNAFGAPHRPLTMAGQFEFAESALKSLAPLLQPETSLLISHGNGPQVGHMLLRVERALGESYAMPLEVCVAETEGELGYVLQQSLHNVLAERGMPRSIVSLLTQVVVSADDPAFSQPSKPIGPFYDSERAQRLIAEGMTLIEDSGRGFRRVVHSPRPLEIVEIEVVKTLLDSGAIVIAAGGGGIPVIRKNSRLRGVEAVVDKDLTAARMAEDLGAELLVILTTVPCVYRDFGTPRQTPLALVTTADAELLLEEGHFAPGSMAPKMMAAIQFASHEHRRVIICDADSLPAALRGDAGTVVVRG